MFKSARILPRYIAKLRGLEDSEPRSPGMTKTNNYRGDPDLDMGAAEDWRSADDDDDADNAGQSDAEHARRAIPLSPSTLWPIVQDIVETIPTCPNSC